MTYVFCEIDLCTRVGGTAAVIRIYRRVICYSPAGLKGRVIQVNGRGVVVHREDFLSLSPPHMTVVWS